MTELNDSEQRVLTGTFDFLQRGGYRNLHWMDQPKGRSLLPLVRTSLPEELKRRCVWLDTLDLGLVPDSINYLLSILVRLEKAYHEAIRLEPRHAHYGREVLVPDPPEGTRLRNFIQEVAMSWDGNLQQRAGRLDSQSYAYESMRIEHARMKITELAPLVDDLAGGIEAYHRLRNPVFILPIDGIDLEPTRWSQLRRFLKLVAVGRLVVLISSEMGEVEAGATVSALRC